VKNYSFSSYRSLRLSSDLPLIFPDHLLIPKVS
jgi:hypothetical protein